MSKALSLVVACVAALCGCPSQPAPVNPLSTAASTTPPPPTASEPPAAVPAIDPKNVGVPLPEESVCEKNPDGSIKDPIPRGKYKGILRNAKCDQQRFLTMGYLCKKLDIRECTYCHAADPKDPKKVIYAEPTEKKRIANWMLATFIEGLRRSDGQPMTCDGCHNDGKGKGMMKILHEPRDKDFAQEWMNEVMTAQFVERDGKRLKCKTCHVGMAPAQEGWNPHVILNLEAKADGSILRVAAPLGKP